MVLKIYLLVQFIIAMVKYCIIVEAINLSILVIM